MAIYIAAFRLAFADPWVAIAFCTFVALIWLVPDRRVEHALPSNRKVVRAKGCDLACSSLELAAGAGRDRRTLQ